MADLTIQAFPPSRLVEGKGPILRQPVNALVPNGFRNMDSSELSNIINQVKDVYNYNEENDVVSLIVLDGGEEGTKILFKPDSEMTVKKAKKPSVREENQFLIYLDDMDESKDFNSVKLLHLKIYFRRMSQLPFTIKQKVSETFVSFQFEHNDLKKTKVNELTKMVELQIRGESGRWEVVMETDRKVVAAHAEAAFFQIQIDPEVLEKHGHRGKHMQGRFRLKKKHHLNSDASMMDLSFDWNEWHETGWFFFPVSTVVASSSPKKSRGSLSPKDKPSRKRISGAASLGFEPSAAAGDGEDAGVTKKSRTNETSKTKKKSTTHGQTEEEFSSGAVGASSSSAIVKSDGSMSPSSRPKQAPSKQAPRSCAKQLKCNFCLKQRGADADYAFDCGHLACKDCYNEKETCLWCKGPPAGRRSIRLPKGKDQKCNQLGCETTIGAIMVPCMCVSWCLSCADFIRNESHRKICLKCPRSDPITNIIELIH